MDILICRLCGVIKKTRPLVVLLVGLLILFVSGCHHEEHREQSPPVVTVMKVKFDSRAEDRTYSGVIVARHEVQEAFRVDGRMAKRLVDVGDRVRAGQVLATLDENDLRLSMESALAEQRASTSNKVQANTDEGRYARLLSQHVVSQSEYDLKHEAADEARGRLERAARSLDLAKNRLNYANLACSTDGVVTKVSAEAGQVVAPGQAIVSVAKDGELEVLVDIPESQIQSLKNAPAEVTLWSSGNDRYQAALREIAPEADSLTRTYAVRYSLQGANPSVRLGMTATLRLSDPTSAQSTRVPASAMFDQGGGLGVWVVEPKTGHLSFRHVAVDRYADRDVYVHGELANGDLIVVAGVQKLDRDMVVRLASSSQEEVQ